MALSIDTVIDYYFFILILCFSDLSFRETGGEVAKERVQHDKRIDVLHSIAYIFFSLFQMTTRLVTQQRPLRRH